MHHPFQSLLTNASSFCIRKSGENILDKFSELIVQIFRGNVQISMAKARNTSKNDEIVQSKMKGNTIRKCHTDSNIRCAQTELVKTLIIKSRVFFLFWFIMALANNNP